MFSTGKHFLSAVDLFLALIRGINLDSGFSRKRKIKSAPARAGGAFLLPKSTLQLLQQAQHALRNGVGLGKHCRAGLRKDLVPRILRRFRSKIHVTNDRFRGLLVGIADIEVVDGMFEPVNVRTHVRTHRVDAVDRAVQRADSIDRCELARQVLHVSRSNGAESPYVYRSRGQRIDGYGNAVGTNRMVGVDPQNGTGRSAGVKAEPARGGREQFLTVIVRDRGDTVNFARQGLEFRIGIASFCRGQGIVRGLYGKLAHTLKY